MPPVAPLMCVLTFPDVSGIAADASETAFVFASSDLAACITASGAFVTQPNTNSTMGGWLGSSRSRVTNAVILSTYELAGFLHGEPHGTPIDVEHLTLPAPFGTVDSPDQLALVMAHNGDLTALPEHGPLVSRPTSEEAQDQGAGATFLAKSRPRASLRGRTYWGPLVGAAIGTDGNPSSLLMVDAAIALHRLRTSVAGAWGVWSRVYGTVNAINGGWILNDFGVQRRRGDKTRTRTPWA